MEIVFLMLLVSFFIAVIFFILFIKAVRSGQYDDMHTPAIRMLFEDELIVDEGKQSNGKIKHTNK